MGIEVAVEKLTKSFGKQMIWEDVTLTLPPGEISVLLGPSGTGKSVFLKSLVGLLKPDRGSIFIRDVDLAHCKEHQLYETRKLFGVLFQDGALFGSMNLFDNIAFPLREHTRKGEKEIREIVLEKTEMVGLSGAEDKLPGEISGGMRKRAGLARALVLDPEIILFDEPDSGLDPVRVAYLNQLIVDLNAQTDATFLIVTHDIGTAQTVPDNLGLLFRRNLVMFGPREVLLTSEEAVVKQFLNGRREGPIGMSEEKDAGQVAAELAALANDEPPAEGTGASGSAVPPQLEPSPGLPRRAAAARRRARVVEMLHTLPERAQEVIRASLEADELRSANGANGGRPSHDPRSDNGPGPAQQMQGLGEIRSYHQISEDDRPTQVYSGPVDGRTGADQPPAETADSNEPLRYADGTLVLPPADEGLGTYAADGGPIGPAPEGSGVEPRTDGAGQDRR